MEESRYVCFPKAQQVNLFSLFSTFSLVELVRKRIELRTIIVRESVLVSKKASWRPEQRILNPQHEMVGNFFYGAKTKCSVAT